MTPEPFPDLEITEAPRPEESDLQSLQDSLSPMGFGPDGEAIFSVGNNEQLPEQPTPEDFRENLAEKLDSGVLNALAARLIEEIEEDLASRSEWERTINTVLKYTGFKVEEFRQVPFVRACGAFDTTLATALIRCFATARAELFPAEGPCKSKIIGIPTQPVEEEGERVKLFMNHFLTDIDEDYYPDSELLLWYTIFFGSAFRKIYQDPILNQPLSRTIKPQDFVVDPNAESILSSNRLTHIMYVDRKEFKLRQRSGEYVEMALPSVDDSDEQSPIKTTIQNQDGVDKKSQENKSTLKVYEIHVNLLESDDLKLGQSLDKDDELDGVEVDDEEPDLLNPFNVSPPDEEEEEEENEIPKPFVVTICDTTRKIVSIKRNWQQNDPMFKRIECFIHYYYLKGFGMYSLGLAHLMGSSAIALTGILRQSIDAELLATFPGGLKTKSMKAENNEVAIGPGEFREIETGDLPISSAIMPLPYKGCSPNILALRESIIQQTSQLGATAESGIPENANNMPVGTTLAILEVANKVQSSFLRSLHHALGRELKILFRLFAEHLTDQPYPFKVPGKEMSIMRKDFSDNVNIVPVSDPNVLTSTHRLLKAQALLQLAQSNPQLHNLHEAYKRMYESMNVENIDKLLIPEPQEMPVDGTTENIYAMTGKPLAVALWQDHDAHNIIHTKFAMEQQMVNPMAYASIMEHIQVHKASKALLELNSMNPQQFQQYLQAPVKQLLTIPEIQNMITMEDAKVTLEQQQQLQQMQDATPKPVDPNVVMMEDINQRREASHLKHEEAAQKVEVEAFKAQLKFKGDTEKIEAQRDMAVDKQEVDLEIAKMRSQPRPIVKATGSRE